MKSHDKALIIILIIIILVIGLGIYYAKKAAAAAAAAAPKDPQNYAEWIKQNPPPPPSKENGGKPTCPYTDNDSHGGYMLDGDCCRPYLDQTRFRWEQNEPNYSICKPVLYI